VGQAWLRGQVSLGLPCKWSHATPERALYLSTFCLRRCTTLLTPSSAGQLGRKLREWGVYKYDSKNRPSDMEFWLHHDGLHEAFGQSFPQAVQEDLPILKDRPVHATFASDLSTAHTEPLNDTDIEHCMSHAGVAETLPDPDEAHSTFNELPEPPEPTEYDEPYLTYSTPHPSPAAISASNNPTAGMGTSQHVKAHEEDAASSVPAVAVMTKELESGRLSNIDMHRFSSLSLTSSESSGFASLRSLAKRILLRQREESTLRGDSLDDPPSSIMDWDRSNSSLQLFGRFSFSSSIASSQVTNGSGMSYTVLSNGSQYSPILTNKIPPPAHACFTCNKPFKSKSSLSRHWKLYCERDKEWVCLLCVPLKNFNNKEKLLQHHIDSHGETCIRDCMQHHDLLCEENIAWSISHLPPKKAWGCPCCLRCFDTFVAWTKHCVNHPLQNGEVIGWSLNTMVQSLILQPYLTDAIMHLPSHMLDLDNAKADVCRILIEAL